LKRASWDLVSFERFEKFAAKRGLSKTGRFGGQSAGGHGAMLYHQSAEHSAFSASLPGNNNLDRELAVGSADAKTPSLPLARYDARALGGHGLLGDRTQLPPHQSPELPSSAFHCSRASLACLDLILDFSESSHHKVTDNHSARGLSPYF